MVASKEKEKGKRRTSKSLSPKGFIEVDDSK
jgi:hypothetical protein